MYSNLDCNVNEFFFVRWCTAAAASLVIAGSDEAQKFAPSSSALTEHEASAFHLGAYVRMYLLVLCLFINTTLGSFHSL